MRRNYCPGSEFKPYGDPGQPGGVLFHVVQLGDLAGGVTKQIGNLTRGEGLNGPICLLQPIDQGGGEGVSQAVESLSLNSCGLKDSVLKFA